MALPEVGSEAPAFELKDQAGETVRLGDLRGKWVVLYFYPRDDTPGCTREACNFRDNFGALKAARATVLGLSPDTEAAHRKFAAKYELPFQLLVDGPEHEVAKAYGAWALKKNYGKEYMGMNRSTVIIAPDGTVAKTWAKVKPDEHGAEVLRWITEHQQAS